jgi:hypothetical protein
MDGRDKSGHDNWGLVTSRVLETGKFILPEPMLALLVTTLFGIIHGFGFAGALLELELPRASLAASLLGFNLGVELGQILVVIPVVMIGRGLARYIGVEMQSAARISLQAALIGLGTFWFVTRALF